MELLQRTHIHRALLFLIVCGLVCGSSVANGESRPIYNDHANARRDIAAAIAQASRTGKNIVLIFGANW